MRDFFLYMKKYLPKDFIDLPETYTLTFVIPTKEGPEGGTSRTDHNVNCFTI